MKGFALGVLITVLIGSFFSHLWSRYQTLDACLALDHGLSAAVETSLRADVQKNLGSLVPDHLTDMLFQPLTEPLVHERIKGWIADRSWFGCSWGVIRLDFGGRNDLVNELLSLTVSLHSS